jgi:uncharacterized protein YjbI with pentapeptide repeats
MSNPLDQIAPGYDVTHEVFGHGVILEYAAPFEIVVRFDDDAVGDRRLHLSFAPVVITRDGEEIAFRDALADQEFAAKALSPEEEARALFDYIAVDQMAIASKAIDVATDDNPVQLQGFALYKQDFTGRRLVGANFTGTHLSQARFAGVNATGAVFIDADLEFADFSGCELAGTDFTGAVMTDAEFRGANLKGAKFAEAGYSLIGFVGANLAGANLAGASLVAADFTGACLQGANLLGADIEEACFDDAILTGATMPDGDLPL